MEDHGIVALLIKDKKFLLLKESRKLMCDFWAPPHGRCKNSDKDEEACVVREVKEETNMDIIPLKKLWTTEADSKIKTVSFRLTKIISDSELIIDTKEVSAYGWFTLEEALQLQLFPGTMKFFTLVKEGKIVL